MIKEILYKWFGLEEKPCESCETLRRQLELVNHEKSQLLELVLEKNRPEPATQIPSNLKPVLPVSLPWRVRQQMLEQEDRQKARVLRQQQEQEELAKKHNTEIESLEKELDIAGEEKSS